MFQRRGAREARGSGGGAETVACSQKVKLECRILAHEKTHTHAHTPSNSFGACEMLFLAEQFCTSTALSEEFL